MSGGIREAADRLGTDAEPAAVAAEVKEWEAALFRITSQLDLDAAGIDAGDSGSERLLALRKAVESDQLRVAPDAGDDPDRSDDSSTRGDPDRRGNQSGEPRSDTAGRDAPNQPAVGSDSNDSSDRSNAARAAARVSEARAPSERITQQLLGTLQDGSVPGIESALERTADAVETAAALDGVDTDPRTAQTAVREAQEASAPLPEPVAAVVDDRLSALDRQLQTVADGDPLVPYAVRREAVFYRDELTETLAGADLGSETTGGDDSGAATETDASGGGGGSERGDGSEHDDSVGDDTAATDSSSGNTDDSMDAAVERVADRRREITELFVNRREDHSHTIPLLFLSTVDDLQETAREAAADGETERADGLTTAALAVLDTVESLYEENQYSVMLRQLRG